MSSAFRRTGFSASRSTRARSTSPPKARGGSKSARRRSEPPLTTSYRFWTRALMRIELAADIGTKLRKALRSAGKRETGGMLFAEQLAPSRFRVMNFSVDLYSGSHTNFRRIPVRTSRLSTPSSSVPVGTSPGSTISANGIHILLSLSARALRMSSP